MKGLRTGRPAMLLVALALAAGGAPVHGQSQDGAGLGPPLTATAHPPISRDPFDLWLAPPSDSRAPASHFAAGVRLVGETKYVEALPLVSRSLAGTVLADYGSYYTGVAQLKSGRLDEARKTFDALLDRPLQGYLLEAVPRRAAETAEARGDAASVLALYDRLAKTTTLAPADVLLRLGRAQRAAGRLEAAARTFARVYYEFALADEAALAADELTQMQAWARLESGSERFEHELGRAERLFGARRYEAARDAFAQLLPHAGGGDTRERVSLRLAEGDYYLGRHRNAREALRPWLADASRRAEARFFYLTATRALGEKDEYVRLARALVADFPQESWAEEALNNLGTHYILVDEDESADATFAELLRRYPMGRHAPRAAWKAGWSAYRRGEYRETIRVFEQAAATFPREDYRPAWLYWSARAHDRLGDAAGADGRYGLTIADYRNSYYGRLAAAQVEGRRGSPAALAAAAAVAPDRSAPAAAPPPTQELIRQLIAHGLYEDALNELRWAQAAWGPSPLLQATMALVHSNMGELRRGITAMKRAYPQYLASGGEDLPDDLLKVIFPMDHWSLIVKYAGAHGLDPFVIAALMAQESTFDAAIRSPANAIGLMQVLPSTGRQYARRLGIRPFRTSSLTRPEVNVRIGMAFFADLVERFGSVHLALASYNAGASAVARWVAERPGVERDEFIDDIPYPETQNYVKKILGTAEDYRRLYADLAPDIRKTSASKPAASRPRPARKPAKPAPPRGE